MQIVKKMSLNGLMVDLEKKMFFKNKAICSLMSLLHVCHFILFYDALVFHGF